MVSGRKVLKFFASHFSIDCSAYGVSFRINPQLNRFFQSRFHGGIENKSICVDGNSDTTILPAFKSSNSSPCNRLSQTGLNLLESNVALTSQNSTFSTSSPPRMECDNKSSVASQPTSILLNIYRIFEISFNRAPVNQYSSGHNQAPREYAFG